jgi:hypothetical protein
MRVLGHVLVVAGESPAEKIVAILCTGLIALALSWREEGL